MNSVTNIFFDFFQVNKIAAKFLTCSKSVSNHLRSSHLLIVKTWIKIIESKMAYSESELDSKTLPLIPCQTMTLTLNLTLNLNLI